MITDVDAVKLDWTWERKPYLAAQRDMRQRRSRKHSRTWLISFSLAAVALLAFGYVAFHSAALGIAFAVFVAGMSYVGGVVGMRVQWYLQARSFEKQCMPKYALMTYFLDPTGLRIQNGDTEVQLGWSAFERWDESNDFILLFTGPAVGYYVPKQDLSPDSLLRARDLLSSGIPGSRNTASSNDSASAA